MGDTIMKAEGKFKLILWDQFGRIKKKIEKSNVITNDGRVLFVNRLIRDTDSPISYIALGVGKNEALSSNSDLGSEPRNNPVLADITIDTGSSMGCTFLDGIMQAPSAMHVKAVTNITVALDMEVYYIDHLDNGNRVATASIPTCSSGDTFNLTLQSLDVAVKDVTGVKCIGGNTGEQLQVVGDSIFRKAATATFEGNGTVRFLSIFNPGEATYPLSEAGLFDVATYTDFVMAARVTFPSVTKDVLDTAAVLWEITFSGG